MSGVTVLQVVAMTGWPHRLAWKSGSFRGYEVGSLGVRAIESSGNTLWSGEVGFEDLWDRHAPKPRNEAEQLHFKLVGIRMTVRAWRHKSRGEQPCDDRGRVRFMPDPEEIGLKVRHEQVVRDYVRAIGERWPSEAL